ncbi:MAG: hypothetical protein A2W31_15505 [Planctomycetes bacterium RBG_16_64_10]|nr:MAG: hypothetical protein A2W31_15505 [Planctomycetes bacterium RBG_16_64_10]
MGVSNEVFVPLTVGTSLFCTCLASLVSAWFQYRRGAVQPGLALAVGLASWAAVLATTRFITTASWYDRDAFQMAFSLVLVLVGVVMLRGRGGAAQGPSAEAAAGRRHQLRWTLAIGTPAGLMAAAVGVGGGLLMVPAYHHVLGLSLRRAVGTSSASVMIISLFGVATCTAAGWGNASVPPTALGYVDVGPALFLALPAAASARLGVWTAHTINTRALRYGFAVIALLVAVRLFLEALA